MNRNAPITIKHVFPKMIDGKQKYENPSKFTKRAARYQFRCKSHCWSSFPLPFDIFFKIWFNLRCLFGVINSALVSVIIIIDLVAVFDAILTSSLYENLMSNNFRKTAVLKKISVVN